jgi:adenine-specific DNA-methyltransferase
VGQTDFSDWSKKDLVKEIKKLKKRKKFGLVWDEEKTKEKFDKDSKDKLPILKEVNSKAIQPNKKRLTNILIEGDNYHTLSVLNYTHKGKIDFIYIDPPYNTGADSFRYNDKIVDKEDGYRHSKWLSFMSKRLKLAKNLLTKNGLIFISIDDNEMTRLKLLCDEIFGEENFLTEIIWKNKFGSGAMNKGYISLHEYILCYSRNFELIKTLEIPYSEKSQKMYNKKDEKFDTRGPYGTWPLETTSMDDRPNLVFAIKYEGEEIWPKKQWLWSKERIETAMKNNEIVFKKNKDKWSVRFKGYLLDKDGNMRKGKPLSIIDGLYTQEGTKELKEIFDGEAIYPFPKPVNLIKNLINIFINKKSTKNSIILDFFAGSGTTGHAVLELNKDDNGTRQFILCTNNEENICTEVCYPRLKKVIQGYTNIKNEKIECLGSNLKYFKTGFVDGKPTDKNKKKLVENCTEMLCLKENCFEELNQTKTYAIFKNHENKYLGIIYDDDGIKHLKKQIKSIDQKFSVYVFSLDDSVREDEFEDVNGMVELKPIPEVILNVYRGIFR